MKLIIAKQHCSDLNLDPEWRGEVLAEIRLKLNELHVLCECHGRGTRKKQCLGGVARTEVWREDQGA